MLKDIVEDAMRKVIRGKIEERYLVPGTKPDGEQVVVDLAAQPIRDALKRLNHKLNQGETVTLEIEEQMSAVKVEVRLDCVDMINRFQELDEKIKQVLTKKAAQLIYQMKDLPSKDSYKPSTDTAYQRILHHNYENWLTIPETGRFRCLDLLQGFIPSTMMLEWKQQIEAKEPIGGAAFHLLGGGMQIRNKLREVILDADLPPVFYNGAEHRNWDDFYLGAIIDLVTTRPIEIEADPEEASYDTTPELGAEDVSPPHED